MRLRRVRVRTSAKGKDFFRYDVTIPPKAVERLGWSAGQDLEAGVRDGELVLRVAKPKRRPRL